MNKTSINNFFRKFRNFWIHGLIKRGKLDVYPATLIIETTNICSLSCSCCPNGYKEIVGRKKGMMSREAFDRILENIDIPLKSVCLYLHGEPFLCKDLVYFVQRLKERKITAVIYSNGYNIDLDMLERILQLRNSFFHFSMDISSKEDYEEIRYPGQYEVAVKCLEEINSVFEKYHSRYEISIITDNQNHSKIKEKTTELFKKYSNLSKISVNSKFPWPRNFYMGDLSGNIEKKECFCKESVSQLAIAWNGDALFCSYDYGGELIVGNIFTTKLSELYNSPQAMQYRRLHYMYRKNDIPLCRECLLPKFYGFMATYNRKDFIK
ncbi:MAG: radical SAM protein [Bacteroidales bacterium]|nr:radical SAM protein [Bacteroidales bacterium]